LELCLREGASKSKFDVGQLAKQLGYSSRQLRRRILSSHGMTPAAYLLKHRLGNAHIMIQERRYGTVAEVAAAVGLSPTYFSRRYRQAYRCDEIKL